jgi:tRNA U34 5-methylaminomethyl-2-thiouridine-forming methyltransferase MnmC
MQREIITTADGSKTIRIKDWDEQYHSIHGAIQEAYHVFIKHGFDLFKKQDVYILEIGFGTGLNALITLLEATKSNKKITYYGVEAYPVSTEELAQLNYISELNVPDFKQHFEQMHSAPWETEVTLSDGFLLYKNQCKFTEIAYEDRMDLIYFDAFGARVQPELWTEDMFAMMFKALKKDGVLVTYAAKGSVRRAMQKVGFKVERLPGPPGKREMLRARKD